MPSKQPHSPGIIEAKLFPDVGAGNPIARERLNPPADFLNGQCSLLLVQAPAGYGKSTLMSHLHDYLAGRKTDCAWLSVDEDDNDPNRFLRYLIASIQQVHPDLLSKSLTQSNTDLANTKAVLEALASNLNELELPLVIFLDDIQFTHTHEVLDILDWLISYAPRQCRFVLGSREEPNLRLGKLRVRRKLLEYGAENLRFTLEETTEFFQRRLDAPLSTQQVQQLHTRTEGWPAGLELAVLALETEPNRDTLIQTFTGDDRSVVDYLGEVVLTNLDDGTRAFLYQISQFDRLCAKLAEHVTGCQDAATRIKNIQTRNLFLIPLDRHAEWYRFHHLVGEYLRNRAQGIDEQACQKSLHLGAQWFYQQALYNEAINCALRAQAWEQAAQWVAEIVETTAFEGGYLQTILNWMDQLPQTWLDRYPAIRISYAFALIFHARRNEVGEQIEHLRNYHQRLATETDPDPLAIEKIACTTEFLELLYLGAQDEGEETRDAALAWLERWPNASDNLRGMTSNVLALGYKSTGAIQEGLDCIQQARRYCEAADAYYNVSWNYILQAYLYMKAGDYVQARQSAQTGLEVIQKRMGGNRVHASMCHAILATIAYEFGDEQALEQHAVDGILPADDYGQADYIILKYLAQARMYFARGDYDSGLEILHTGEIAAREHELERARISLAAEECVWLCRLNRLDDARKVAKQAGIATSPAEITRQGLQLDKAYRTGSRLYLHEAPEQTAQALASGIEYCRKRGYMHRCVELMLIQANAYRRAGDVDLAVNSLKQALLIGQEYHYYRMFLDEARELGDLMLQLKLKDAAEKSATPLLTRLQRSLKSDPEAAKSEGQVEQLSKREKQIIKRLDSDLSNREIAEAIFVSEGTLKWHLHNIYGKLGVKNRSGALSRGRELNYL